MKSIIYNILQAIRINHLSLMALIIIFASCEKNETFDASNEAFTLRLTTEQSFEGEDPQPMSAATRSGTSHIDNFVAQAFSDDSYTIPVNIFADGTENRATSTTGEFAVKLDRTKDYYLLLWADEGDGTYNYNDLEAVTLNNNKEVGEAYAGKLTIEAGSTIPSTISLKRAVAKISLRNTHAMEADKWIEVSYQHYTSYNVNFSSSSGQMTNYTTTLTTTAAEAGEEFASVWLLGSQNEKTIDFTYNYEGEGDNTVENVPYQANRRTNLKGEYIAPTGTYKIGDTYPKGSTTIGVVFSITDDTDKDGYGDAGKIVSLDEGTNKTWAEAKTWANNYNAGGKDWYCPSSKELRELYAGYSGLQWIASGTAGVGEIVDWGDNYQMPNYSSYSEAQTSFNTKITSSGVSNATALDDGFHWSSTEHDNNSAYLMHFSGGNSFDDLKDNSGVRVRAVFAF